MRRTIAMAVAMITGLVLVAGCGDDEIVEVTQPPAIQVRVQAAPTSVDTGEKVAVQAIIERAPAGATLQYSWVADGGVFSASDDASTGWTAPDNPGIYAVSVVVTDGKNAGIGSADIGVAVYLPADSPYYKGATSCALCHNGGTGGDQYASWSATAHATAQQSLAAIGMGENASCLKCHTVGSYTVTGVDSLDNGGYDESAVPRLAGVQCENCHGPGSLHTTGEAQLGVTLAASLCGQCHTDTHHPTYDEWQTSAHASGATWTEASPPGMRGSCSKCHNGLVAAAYLDAPTNFPTPPNPTALERISCAACHDPHGNDNPGNLRAASVTDIWIPNNVLVEEAGAGRLCISCHNGRRTETDVLGMINNGSAHFGPHHSIQGDMLKGVNAYQNLNSTFPWSSSKHILVEDACIACHTHAHEGDPDAGIPNFTGHDFLPQEEACVRCHGPITTFEDIEAKADFDGDGTIEGVQLEIEGLLQLLQQTIADASRNDTVRQAMLNPDTFVDTVGDTTQSLRPQREAAYNWCYVDFDGSRGVHNATYSVQLLQQSILYLDPNGLPLSAYILKEDM